jgi:hypothetical protein
MISEQREKKTGFIPVNSQIRFRIPSKSRNIRAAKRQPAQGKTETEGDGKF